jgi:hypothetical protein
MALKTHSQYSPSHFRQFVNDVPKGDQVFFNVGWMKGMLVYNQPYCAPSSCVGMLVLNFFLNLTLKLVAQNPELV